MTPIIHADCTQFDYISFHYIQLSIRFQFTKIFFRKDIKKCSKIHSKKFSSFGFLGENLFFNAEVNYFLFMCQTSVSLAIS